MGDGSALLSLPPSPPPPPSPAAAAALVGLPRVGRAALAHQAHAALLPLLVPPAAAAAAGSSIRSSSNRMSRRQRMAAAGCLLANVNVWMAKCVMMPLSLIEAGDGASLQPSSAPTHLAGPTPSCSRLVRHILFAGRAAAGWLGTPAAWGRARSASVHNGRASGLGGWAASSLLRDSLDSNLKMC